MEKPYWITRESWDDMKAKLEKSGAASVNATVGGPIDSVKKNGAMRITVSARLKNPHPADVLVNDDRYLVTWFGKAWTKEEFDALPEAFAKWRDEMIAHGPIPA